MSTFLLTNAGPPPPLPPFAWVPGLQASLTLSYARSVGHLYQDVARTVKAQVNNDPVRVAIDAKGNVFTAPSDAARPVLNTDGSGHWWLTFNGTSSELASPASFAQSTGDPLCTFVAGRIGGDSQCLCCAGNAALGVGALRGLVTFGTDWLYNGNGADFNTGSVADTTADHTHVSRVINAFSVKWQVDTTEYAGPVTSTGLAGYTASVLRIGARSSGAGDFFLNGRVYAVGWAYSNLSDANRDKLRTQLRGTYA